MAEKLHFAQTKLITPQRRKELLSRPRLLELMSDLLDFRLIIVAAPAGYGKTSLLIDFASQFEWPVCWYALDPLDQDFERFLTYFIHAIQSKFPEFGEASLQLLAASTEESINADFLISTLTNDIYENITEHFVVVLDDYHLLKSNAVIDQFLSDFIQRADDNCHVVITSRNLLTFPDLPLMVARSQVGGLSIEELAFSPEEIQDLFGNVFQKPIDRQEAQDLAARTEGWITGLLLTSQMLKTGMGEQVKVARASGVGLYEYLAQQVLDQQPAVVRDFLLNTSILEEFNAHMCQEVVGKALSIKENWPKLLTQVILNNLFVLPVDDESNWIRYHHLFRDFLKATLQKERPDDAAAIKKELADFFIQHEEWERAFEIYTDLNNESAIAGLIEKAGSRFIARGKVNKLSEWLGKLPERMIYENPALLSLKASVTVIKGNLHEGKELLDRVVDILRSPGNESALAENLIRRSAALRITGDYASAMADAQEATAICEKNPEQSATYSEALRAKGVILMQSGDLGEALRYYQEALQICQSRNLEEDVARILVEIGIIHGKMGKYALAEKAYEKSLSYWRSIGDSIWQPTILNNLGWIQHLSGNFADSFNNFEKAMQYAQMTGNRRMEGYSLASIGDLYKDLGAGKEAKEAYQQAIEIAQQTEDQYLIFYLRMARARMHLLEGQSRQAETQIRSAQTIAKKSGSSYEMNKYRLEQAALDYAAKSYPKALEQLEATSAYFNEEAMVEDAVRSEALQCLALARCGQGAQAAMLMQIFLERLSEPERHIPGLSTLNELKNEINALVNAGELGPLWAEIRNDLDGFQTLSQKSRRKIRKQASVVPFAQAKLEIRAFGRAEVCINKHSLTIADWKTQTSRDLFFLFLSHPEGLTKEEVGLYFWPDSSAAELKLRFKNAIYRMRHAIGSDAVLFQDNFYQFNRALDYEYDVQNFLNSLTQAKDEVNILKKKQVFDSAVAYYNGAYLPEMDEIWVIPERQKYLDLFLKAASDLAILCLQLKEYEEGLHVCQMALAQDSCNEELHRLSMQLHAALGNRGAVSKQFELCRKLLEEELAAEPSAQTTQLYEQLVR